jgi:hypothetical protein
MRFHGSAGGAQAHSRYIPAVADTRRPWRRIVGWAGAAAGLAVAAVALPLLLAAGWLRYEKHAWTRADPRAAGRLDGERPEGANETARRLTELVRPLGVELQVFRSSDPDLAPAIAFVEAERVAEGDRDDEAVATPALAELLARHDGALRAVEELLVASEPPAWPHDFRVAYDARPPPVLGLRTLSALLLSRAGERARAGDRPGTERALVASSRLDDGVRDRPEAITQLTGVALAVERAGVLRRLPSSPAGWTRHMGEHDFRSSFLANYAMEARVSMDYARRPAASYPTSLYARLSAADASRRMRRLAGGLRAVEPCRADAGALADAPAWNPEARRMLPYAAQRWGVVRHAELEEELTRVVMETRAQPPLVADVRASRVCGGLGWERTPDGAGGTVVAASGVALPPRTRGASWRYRVKAAPVVAPPSLSR